MLAKRTVTHQVLIILQRGIDSSVFVDEEGVWMEDGIKRIALMVFGIKEGEQWIAAAEVTQRVRDSERERCVVERRERMKRKRKREEQLMAREAVVVGRGGLLKGRRGWNRRLVGYVLAGALAAAERGRLRVSVSPNPYEEMCVRRRESHFVIIAMTYRSCGFTDEETLQVSAGSWSDLKKKTFGSLKMDIWILSRDNRLLRRQSPQLFCLCHVELPSFRHSSLSRGSFCLRGWYTTLGNVRLKPCHSNP